MTTKTTTAAKPKTASPEKQLAKLRKQMASQAASNWQKWAIAVADDEGDFPPVADLLAAASALDIDDAVAALRADADAIIEARVAARNAAACKQIAVDMLAPFGGDTDKVLQAIENAKAEVERLQAIYRNACDDCGAAYYRSTVHHCRVKHPRVWPNYNDTGMGVDL
jgi:hypothetical protein